MAFDESLVIVRICGQTGSQSSGAHRGIDEWGSPDRAYARARRTRDEPRPAGTRPVNPDCGSVRPARDPCQPALKADPLLGFTLRPVDEEVTPPAVLTLNAQPGGGLTDVPSNESNRHWFARGNTGRSKRFPGRPPPGIDPQTPDDKRLALEKQPDQDRQAAEEQDDHVDRVVQSSQQP